MIAIAICVAAFCAIHWFRGRGYLPFASHALASICEGLAAAGAAWAAGLSARDIAIVFALAGAGMFAWVVMGWGKYFSCFTGTDNPNESEVRWIDWAGYKVFPVDGLPETNRARGAFCFALRGLHGVPMFVAFAIAFGPACLLPALLTPGQALCNMAGRIDDNWKRYGRAVPEICEGALFGLAVGIVIFLRSLAYAY